MDQGAIARVFREMSDLLEIEGGDPHRARAFSTAARVLDELRVPIETALADGSLARRRGMGEGTIGRIKEILRTGTCRTHQELLRAVPSSLRDMLPIPGLGPRTARVAWQALGVTTLDGLLEAARDGRLARVAGFTDEGALVVRDAIEAHRAKPARLLWHEAEELARPLLGAISSSGLVSDVTMVGSFRRKKPTVGDLDLVAGAADPQALVAFFTSHSEVVRVLMRGYDRARVRLKNGQKSDLWIVPPDVVGAGILAFTSAAPHNIAIRIRASKMGLHVSEYGVVDERTRARAASSATEADVYKALGLPFIAPELREGRGEIEAALKGRLPNLLEESALKWDAGAHLVVDDGDGDAARALDALASVCAARGLQGAVILVDDAAARATSRDALRAARDASEARHSLALPLARLVTVDARGVSLDDEGFSAWEFVVVTAPRGAVDGDALTEGLARAVESGRVDAILAPLGRTHVSQRGATLDHARLARACRRHDVVLLVAGDPARVDPDDETVRAFVDEGVHVGIATDTARQTIARALQSGTFCLRRAWAPVEHVVNARAAARWPRPPRHAGSAASAASLSTTTTNREWRFVSAMPEASPSADTSLASALDARPLAPDVRARVERFLVDGSDAALAEELARRGENALQVAFALLVEG